MFGDDDDDLFSSSANKPSSSITSKKQNADTKKSTNTGKVDTMKSSGAVASYDPLFGGVGQQQSQVDEKDEDLFSSPPKVCCWSFFSVSLYIYD